MRPAAMRRVRRHEPDVVLGDTRRTEAAPCPHGDGPTGERVVEVLPGTAAVPEPAEPAHADREPLC